MTAPAPRRLLWLLAPVAAFAATLALLAAVQGGGGAAAPTMFDRPGPATVDVPPGRRPPRRSRRRARRSTDEPGDAALHATLGDLYYQRGRETANAIWNERAHDAYDARARAGPAERPGHGRARHARARQARLRRRPALRPARRCALAPESVRPYPAIVDGQVELGRYRDGGALARPDGLAEAEPRLLRAHLLLPRAARRPRRRPRGDATRGLRRRRLRRERRLRRRRCSATSEFQRGDSRAAGAAYRTALARVPDYLPAAAGLATIDAAHGDLDTAIRRYRPSCARPRCTSSTCCCLRPSSPTAARRRRAARSPSIRENQALEREPAASTPTRSSRSSRPSTVGRARRRARALGGPHAPSVSPPMRTAGRSRAPAGRGRCTGPRALRPGWRDPLVRYHAGMAAKARRRALARAPWLTQASH